MYISAMIIGGAATVLLGLMTSFYALLTCALLFAVALGEILSLVFRIFTKDYCIQLAKPQGEQISRKAPPSFLPFGEILDSYRGT